MSSPASSNGGRATYGADRCSRAGRHSSHCRRPSRSEDRYDHDARGVESCRSGKHPERSGVGAPVASGPPPKRTSYIEALSAADRHDFAPLLSFARSGKQAP